MSGRKKFLQKTDNYLDNYRNEYTGGDQSGHAYVQDPTVFLATESLEKIRINQGTQWESVVYHPEDWLEIIDDVIDLLKGDEFIGDVLVGRYFFNESMGETCKRLGISVAQYRVACIIGTNRMVFEAINCGLLDVKYM